MTRSYRLTKGNSEDIGFASTCLVANAISFSEFKEWIYYVIQHTENVPTYLFEILDIDEKYDYTLKRQSVIGFTPSWEGTNQEENALDGIAYKRNLNHKSDSVNREDALKALEEQSHIEKHFREMFPFIKW
ncbi:hypothetical protein [Candidatus Thiodiazotropha sp. CDECU1]|uniref:hypothetical protein n=1 Tax=Candidatus Thiodiazotropha sp. CDECU1 TaxID=3065865 RepID=UPI0029317A18|nr:hypothetical protein [Candidatus Thiodiazotropha sp. CDECU1]